MRKMAVIAIGGNSLIQDSHHQTVPDQLAAAAETCRHIASIVQQGWDTVIGHGNGPQVGFILRRSELARGELHEVPLDACVADTQGAIGYALQQSLHNEFRRLDVDRHAISLVTQVEVAADDPAFENPTKPIGTYMDERQAKQREQEEGWSVVEDAGRGWRRVVPSPRPMRIVEEEAVRVLIREGFVVVTVGGGGVPVVADDDGSLRGVAAVIDKDLACSLLARAIGADLFVITTAVDRVALNFGKSNEEWISRMTRSEAKRYLDEGGHFAPGSMAPKIQAVVEYLEPGMGEAIITRPENLERALAGDGGTRIVAD